MFPIFWNNLQDAFLLDGVSALQRHRPTLFAMERLAAHIHNFEIQFPYARRSKKKTTVNLEALGKRQRSLRGGRRRSAPACRAALREPERAARSRAPQSSAGCTAQPADSCAVAAGRPYAEPA